ncbi:hypothetical protein BTO06_06790 [Tenacibaculum sp. SZ-18]|nr:hypothetical protein BTO06_06790 [Tenacibaculum sp. SZ-18]
MNLKNDFSLIIILIIPKLKKVSLYVNTDLFIYLNIETIKFQKKSSKIILGSKSIIREYVQINFKYAILIDVENYSKNKN